MMQSSESKNIANRLKNDYIQCLDMWQKIQLIVIKIMSLGYTGIGERIGKEIDRVAPRVENEVKRSVDKIAKEAKRFFRKF
ncbi:hypothetical protein [Symbiopectobacterium sp. RP]|uniref:hypothetical protein n=1 Tax=Symbiopectobacterium sp. RP TaxID=3248553 RepID=UPI003D2B6A1A